MIKLVINILSLLKAFGGKLERVKVYGKIVARLNRPSNLLSNCTEREGGTYVKVDVFAIDLSHYQSYLKDYGYCEKDNIYLVAEGSTLCTYVPLQGYKYPDFYEIDGTLRLGSRTSNEYCVMFNFIKGSNNNWTIGFNSLNDIEFSNWTDGTQHKTLGLRMGATNNVEYAPESNTFPPMCCIDKHIEVNKPEATVSYEPEQRVITSKVTHHQSREVIKEFSNIAKELKDKLDSSKTSLRDFTNKLKLEYFVNDDSYIRDLANRLNANLKHKVSPVGNTGRSYLLRYIKDFKNADKDYLGSRKVYDVLIDHFSEIIPYMLDGEEVMLNGVAYEVCRNAFGNAELFYAGVVSKIVGIDLVPVAQTCMDNSIVFSKLINENPYALQLISDLSFKDIEHLALCFGKSTDNKLSTYRNISILNSFINDTSDGSTLFNKNDLQRKKLGMKLTESNYNKIRQKGTYLSDTLVSDLKTFLGTTIVSYDLNGYRKIGYEYVKPFSSQELEVIIANYETSGLGVSFNQYITSSKYLEKELFVYEKLHYLGSKETGYSIDKIEKCIDDFEAMKGFKLEPEQRDSIRLLRHYAGVTAGSAGSGKTTTSEGLVYVLESLEPNVTIKFAAPTGRASKRMQEVVKRPVKTMAMEFRAGYETSNGLFDIDDIDGSQSNVTYLLDECAMVTIDLMYKILKKSDESTKFYFYGDYHQLPPIGKGVPFKNMLRFMPCVFLLVSKRAAEGSQITNVSNIINEKSEVGNWETIESKDDFFLCPCPDDKMQSLTIAICKYYLGQKLTSIEENLLGIYVKDLERMKPDFSYTPDDIQVVTPISKPSYIWGSHQINKVLEPIFNSNNGYNKTFTYYKSENDEFYSKFVIGDRVTHKDTNMYSMQWYGSYKDGQFQKLWGYGICNGEIGTIVDIVPAETCEFLDQIEPKPNDYEERQLRDDSTFSGWFIVVKYYDYMDDRDFYILYRCEECTSASNNVGRAFKGNDLSMIDLFYAGTTHKLQGSQAKIIISLLGVVNFKGFITRNMMYTVYTRGQELVFALGSVANDKSSMLSIARTEVAERDVLTVGEIL